MSNISDLGYLERAEELARAQGEVSNSITARIAHFARAAEYASKAAQLRDETYHGR